MDENRLVMEMEDFRHLLFGYLNFGFMLLQFGGNFNLVVNFESGWIGAI